MADNPKKEDKTTEKDAQKVTYSARVSGIADELHKDSQVITAPDFAHTPEAKLLALSTGIAGTLGEEASLSQQQAQEYNAIPDREKLAAQCKEQQFLSSSVLQLKKEADAHREHLGNKTPEAIAAECALPMLMGGEGKAACIEPFYNAQMVQLLEGASRLEGNEKLLDCMHQAQHPPVESPGGTKKPQPKKNDKQHSH